VKQAGIALVAKSIFDRSVAATALLLTAPVLGCAALAVRATMGSPILFTQTRPGKRGKPFKLYKLRTMLDARAPDGSLLSDDQRLTPLGKLLRASSVDDLPNLLNVLKGELSLVGPRPLLMSYLALYTEEQARRHDVLPGITGWAQIHGRNAVSHEDKFELDAWYVDHWTPWLDVRILVRTLGTVLRRDGVSDEGHATKEVWRGNTAQGRA
jgi:lipopolysaccharide/colanic/teichoic acid biosynthesis glycosyltransferase